MSAPAHGDNDHHMTADLRPTSEPTLAPALPDGLQQSEASVSQPRKPRASEVVTCGGCDHTWTATNAAHCASRGCHRTFSTARLFDLHRSAKGGDRGSCQDPEQIRNVRGERIMWLRDGMWRGPEMTDEQKLARRGNPEAAA